ncbi:MAG TPA: hypothetical protein VFU17_15805, partial [Candidatus Limnocylindrales bacterium]|nr:hypothetical protein [Candidatus Limnocylindrales bacterium]
MAPFRIVDVTDHAAFELVPPCADPSFDHRTCDYWEDADRGSKAARAAWLKAGAPSPTDQSKAPRSVPANPFLADLEARQPATNPFVAERPTNPFLTPGDDDDGPLDNPFAPTPVVRPTVGSDAPRKLQLLG